MSHCLPLRVASRSLPSRVCRELHAFSHARHTVVSPCTSERPTSSSSSNNTYRCRSWLSLRLRDPGAAAGFAWQSPCCSHAARGTRVGASSASLASTEKDIKRSALVLLLHESLKRATGRTLVEVDDLLRLPAAIDELTCCVIIATPRTPGDEELDADCPASGWEVAYTNAAADHMLTGTSLRASAQQPPPPGGVMCGAPLSRLVPELPAQLLPLPPQGTSTPPQPRIQLHKSVQLRQGWQPDTRGVAADAPAGPPPGRACQADVLAADVCSPSGRTLGIAIMYDSWRCETDGRCGRPLLCELAAGDVPGQAQVQAAQEAIRAQADAVRSLKVSQGLTNQHPDVKAGVARLNEAKVAAAEAEAQQRAFDPSNQGVLASFMAECMPHDLM